MIFKICGSDNLYKLGCKNARVYMIMFLIVLNRDKIWYHLENIIPLPTWINKSCNFYCLIYETNDLHRNS